MKAILLAAGRGRRLGISGPKCLVKVAGRTLLDRHLHNMAAAGISGAVVVTGHARDELHAELERIDAPIEVETVYNERFVHGSLVSLACAVERIQGGGIWMDADVLYPASLLAKLVASEHGNCVLLDGRSAEQGEEMMLAVKANRVHAIARSVGTDWDLVGESVGFFKADAAGVVELKRVLDQEVAANRLDQEHEDALNKAFATVVFGHERVDEFSWTEIDFPADVERANELASQVDGG